MLHGGHDPESSRQADGEERLRRNPRRRRREKPIGVITDRDIVCRVVAEDRNPSGLTVQEYMSQPAVTVRGDAPLAEVVSTMEKHQIRRIPVTDERGRCAGIIAQADVATIGSEHAVSQLVREVSRDTGVQSR